MKQATFVLCGACEKHGRIVFADDTLGQEFCSQEAGLIIVGDGLMTNRYVEETALRLSDAIRRSRLPRTFADEEVTIRWKVETWNRLRETSTPPDIGAETIHAFVSQPLPVKGSPPQFVGISLWPLRRRDA